MIEIPNPGDLLKVYQFTPPNPNGIELREFAANPWQPPFPGCKKLLIFECPIVCLRRHKRGQEVVITITSEYFQEPGRSQGVKIPLHCVEIVQRDYGLPALTVAVEPVAPVVPVVVEVEQLRIA